MNLFCADSKTDLIRENRDNFLSVRSVTQSKVGQLAGFKNVRIIGQLIENNSSVGLCWSVYNMCILCIKCISYMEYTRYMEQIVR